jgi:hypothetical protein
MSTLWRFGAWALELKPYASHFRTSYDVIHRVQQHRRRDPGLLILRTCAFRLPPSVSGFDRLA